MIYSTRGGKHLIQTDDKELEFEFYTTDDSFEKLKAVIEADKENK